MAEGSHQLLGEKVLRGIEDGPDLKAPGKHCSGHHAPYPLLQADKPDSFMSRKPKAPRFPAATWDLPGGTQGHSLQLAVRSAGKRQTRQMKRVSTSP